MKVSKGAKIRNRYNQVSHLTQDTNEKVTNSQLDTTTESQEPYLTDDWGVCVKYQLVSSLQTLLEWGYTSDGSIWIVYK